MINESHKGKGTINDREPRKRGGLADKRTKEDQEFNLKDFISDAFSFEYHKNALLE